MTKLLQVIFAVVSVWYFTSDPTPLSIMMIMPVQACVVLFCRLLFPRDFIDVMYKMQNPDPYLTNLEDQLDKAESAGDKEEIERLSNSITLRTGKSPDRSSPWDYYAKMSSGQNTQKARSYQGGYNEYHRQSRTFFQY